MSHLLSMLERLSANVNQPQISPLCPSSMLFYRLKEFYLAQKRTKKQKEMETRTSVFTLHSSNLPPAQASYNYSTASLIPYTIHNLTPITPESIISLIKIADIADVSNTQLMNRLEDCLVRKICLLKNPQNVLDMFRRLVYMRKYLGAGEEKYRQIQDRMVKELMIIKFKGCNPDKVVKFVLGLPYRNKTLLQLLSHFIEEIDDEASIKVLYSLFTKLLPDHPTQDQIRCLLSISTKEVTAKIHEMIKMGDIQDVRLLQQEAKKKLKKVPGVFNAKGEAIMLFVSYVVSHGGDIWLEIIDWERTAIQQYKNWFKAKAESIVRNQNSQQSLPLILHNLTDVNYQSEISELFFDHVTQQGGRDMVNSYVVKNFLVSKLLYKFQKMVTNGQEYLSSKLPIFFNPNLVYTDILLEIFSKESQCYDFYSYFLQTSEESSRILFDFLSRVYEKQKFKFVEFFLCFTNTSSTPHNPPKIELLLLEDNKLMLYFLAKVDFELAYILVKELSVRTPQKFYFLFLNSWLKKFQAKSKFPVLKTHIIRNLNTVLVRSDMQLSIQFLNDFKHHFYNQPALTAEDRSKLMADVAPARRQSLGV